MGLRRPLREVYKRQLVHPRKRFDLKLFAWMDAGVRRGFRGELHHVCHGSELIRIRSGEMRRRHRRRKRDWPLYRSPARTGRDRSYPARSERDQRRNKSLPVVIYECYVDIRALSP
jgi:hypothetical protein